MSLTTRVSAFFLIALAVVLASFSGALYLLARTYLVRQLDERLQLSLDTLEAAVDIEPGGLEWEPADRKMELGVDAGINAVRWMVRDGGGGPVDGSLNSRHSRFPSDWSPPPPNPNRTGRHRLRYGPGLATGFPDDPVVRSSPPGSGSSQRRARIRGPVPDARPPCRPRPLPGLKRPWLAWP